MADNLPPRPRRIPPHILRRRRIVAVVILIVLLALIGWGIWALIGLFLPDDEESSPTPEPTVSESVEPSPSESPSDKESEQAADACDPEVLSLAGSTDQEAYAEDEFPMFAMTITHDGDELCDASLGPDEQNFVVEDSEGEYVFSTQSCQVDPQSQVVEMEPGQSESVEFQWERVGTDEDCQSVVEDISAGEYQLTVGMGEQTADPVSFELQ